MKFIKKVNIAPQRQEQFKTQRYESPGPGSYDISLPLIRPNYEAIKKKNDIVILKINHLGQSCNFRSEQQRFPDQKQKSPGPAQYASYSLQLKKKDFDKKYSQRYDDLIEFMYRDRSHIGSIPDYKVQYENQYQKVLKKIKNSHRRYKERAKQQQSEQRLKLNRKQSICSTSTIVKIKSTSRLSISDINSINNDKEQTLSTAIREQKNAMRTIDFPGVPQNHIVTKRPLSLEKQQNLMLHKKTFYNRNMLGMLMAKKNNRIDKAIKLEQSSVKTAVNDKESTIDAS